jgi:hypothetical protein
LIADVVTRMVPAPVTGAWLPSAATVPPEARNSASADADQPSMPVSNASSWPPASPERW